MNERLIAGLLQTNGPWQVCCQERFEPPGEGIYPRGVHEQFEDAVIAAIEISGDGLRCAISVGAWESIGAHGLVFDSRGIMVFEGGYEFKQYHGTDRGELPVSAFAGECPPLDSAIALAAEAHRGQLDKAGICYLTHPLRVMLRLVDPIARIAAILHDVLEDTSRTREDLRRAGFPPVVLAVVEILTKGATETYEAFIERCAANPIARQVKLADLADNMDLTRLPEITEKDRQRLARYEAAKARLLRDERTQ